MSFLWSIACIGLQAFQIAFIRTGTEHSFDLDHPSPAGSVARARYHSSITLT
jgi:hypothetical protein